MDCIPMDVVIFVDKQIRFAKLRRRRLHPVTAEESIYTARIPTDYSWPRALARLAFDEYGGI